VAATYAAATTNPLHLLSFRGDLNNLEEPASPESAIFRSASALKRSTATYSSAVNIGQDETSGRREKSGRRRGAWW
jgi:hypothetical protein